MGFTCLKNKSPCVWLLLLPIAACMAGADQLGYPFGKLFKTEQILNSLIFFYKIDSIKSTNFFKSRFLVLHDSDYVRTDHLILRWYVVNCAI